MKSALISVFDKNGLEPILNELRELDVEIFSTGGTQKFITSLGFRSVAIENITDYPSILGGRVKSLHPKVFGGILARREIDQKELAQYNIDPIDLVIVDLYPFEETTKHSSDHKEIIEKIDIGGISLIRAAAKNYKDVLVIPSKNHYTGLLKILREFSGVTTEEHRRKLASEAFALSAHYDSLISNFLSGNQSYSVNFQNGLQLRYGENPHQQGMYYGDANKLFDQIQGKQLSFNNLVDIDAALNLLSEFEEQTFLVIKHTNPCGIASRENQLEAWKEALSGDPVSAFGGIIATNRKLKFETAKKINELFYEVLIAPDFEEDALKELTSKKKRIILKYKKLPEQNQQIKSVLNGILVQDADMKTETEADLKAVTKHKTTEKEIKDLIFANKVVKHTKSNAIVLVKDKKLVGIGTGQTSRVDAAQQAVDKARKYDLELEGAVMASDAFFPFPDSIEVAVNAGITAVIQPGGSVRDQESVDFCNKHNVKMVVTGVRHFKH